MGEGNGGLALGGAIGLEVKGTGIGAGVGKETGLDGLDGAPSISRLEDAGLGMEKGIGGAALGGAGLSGIKGAGEG
jgi:hypothetical protein